MDNICVSVTNFFRMLKQHLIPMRFDFPLSQSSPIRRTGKVKHTTFLSIAWCLLSESATETSLCCNCRHKNTSDRTESVYKPKMSAEIQAFSFSHLKRLSCVTLFSTIFDNFRSNHKLFSSKYIDKQLDLCYIHHM